MDYQEIYYLDEKINLLYDYVYNHNTTYFSIKKIILGKISIDDIKIPFINLDKLKMNEEDQQAELTYYNDNINDILNAKFKQLDDSYLEFKRYSEQFPVLLKIKFYKKNEINLIESKINNDSLFSYILSELVLMNKIKHVLLPIMNIDVKCNNISKIINNELNHKKIKDLINTNKMSNICCLQLREFYFKMKTLENYLINNEINYKLLIFQIIHTIGVIQSEFEGFRHNNLILKNIYIYCKNSDNYMEYDGFNNDKFYINNCNIDIKIHNFDNSIIPKYYGLFNNNENINNPYYDIYIFLNDLWNFITINKKIINKELINFFNLYLPVNIRNNYNNTILVKPSDLIYDIFFDEYKNSLPSKPVSNSNNLTGIKSNSDESDSDESNSDESDSDESDNDESDINKSSINKIDSKKSIIKEIIIKQSDSEESIIKQSYSEEIIIKQSDSEQSDSVELYINESDSKELNNNIKSNNYNINTIIDSDKIYFLGDQKNIYNKNNKKSNTNIMTNINMRIINKKKEDNIIIRKNIINMKGGSNKQEVAPYKKEKNTPFVSNDQKKINDNRNKENPHKEQPIILEQKIYDTSHAPQKQQFPPSFIPLYGEDGAIMNPMLPYSNMLNQPPIQKVYNISLSNPLGNYSSISKIYEDMLPGEQNNFTSLTIFERCQLIDFLRNNIIESYDGEEMTITGGKNSLLSYIKILDVNPYTMNKNPYIDLPRNFLLYRAAYPVRFDQKSKGINIGKPSMGINIRIYMMTYGDINCKKINFIDSDDFDLWREIKYYDIIKNEIFKKKVSPNFICPILYKIDSQSKINWTSLESIKSKGLNYTTSFKLRENQKRINNIHDIYTQDNLLSQFIPKNFKLNKKNDVILEIDQKEDITINSGQVLILLTEAPTTSMAQWSSSAYESFGSVKKMISSGYHAPNVWKSILFQLVYAFSILQEKEIIINNISFENNIYIKDINADYNSIGSWIYKVDGLDYYIPNYGYILVIDTKYTDINIPTQLIETINDEKNKEFKIYGPMYTKNHKYNDRSKYKQIIREQFRSIINPDNFGHNFKINGGSIPDDTIIQLLKNICDNTTHVNIKDYISEYFLDFLHNRIGTALYKTEKEIMNLYYRPNVKSSKGKLVPALQSFGVYCWVLYIDVSPIIPNSIDVITCENDIYFKKTYHRSNLYLYPDNEIIMPESKKNMKYDELHIYETYNLDNIII